MVRATGAKQFRMSIGIWRADGTTGAADGFLYFSTRHLPVFFCNKAAIDVHTRPLGK